MRCLTTTGRRSVLGRPDNSEAARQVSSSDVAAAEAAVAEAVRLIHEEQPGNALVACDRALALVPDHPQGWLFRGVALHRLGQYQAAYACYECALQKGDRRTSQKSWQEQIRLWLKQVGQVSMTPL